MLHGPVDARTVGRTSVRQDRHGNQVACSRKWRTIASSLGARTLSRGPWRRCDTVRYNRRLNQFPAFAAGRNAREESVFVHRSEFDCTYDCHDLCRQSVPCVTGPRRSRFLPSTRFNWSTIKPAFEEAMKNSLAGSAGDLRRAVRAHVRKHDRGARSQRCHARSREQRVLLHEIVHEQRHHGSVGQGIRAAAVQA